MGEIRVKLNIANWMDQELFDQGELAANRVRRLEVEAVVDTGAVKSIVPVAVAQQLGVASGKRSVAQYADDRTDAVEVTKPIIFEFDDRSTTETAMILGDEVLIGQTTLETTDLLADCTRQRLVPNPDHPHQPVFKVRFAR